jgi:hypothetical protein
VSDAWFDRIYLEDEQRKLLSWMVESEQLLPPEQHGPFYLFTMMDKSFLLNNHIAERPQVRPGDLNTLAEHGLLRRTYARKSHGYEIKPQGRRYYTEMMRRAGAAAVHVEVAVRQHLDSASFQSRFPVAYERWRVAEDALWDADSEEQYTKIGHGCREAIQEFAATIADECGVTDTPDDPAKTVIRIRTVLDRQGLDGRRRSFLDALLAYWRAVSDLVQRQEHGSGKQGDRLTWEDARRVTFQSMLVMYEVSRAVSRMSVESDSG